jgi:hypothetical protein
LPQGVAPDATPCWPPLPHYQELFQEFSEGIWKLEQSG